MGSRGDFQSVDANNFTFVDGGQTYHCIGYVDDIKVLIREKGNSVKAPLA